MHDAARPGRPDARATTRERERAAALAAVVEDLGAELSLRPLLERILDRSITLLGGDAGSICLVDEAGRRLPQGGRHRRRVPVRARLSAQRGRHRRGGRAAGLRGVPTTTPRCPAGTCPRRTVCRCAASSASRSGGAWASSAPASSSAATRTAPSARRTPGLLELFATHAALAITYARLHESRRDHRPGRGRRRGAQPHGPRGPRHGGQGARLGAPSAALRRGGPGRGPRLRAAGRHRGGSRRRPLRARGDAAQRARAGALAARGPLARGGPGAGAGLGQPHRRRRRTPRGGRRAGPAADRGGALALPHRPGGAHQRPAPRRGRLGAHRPRLRALGP